MHDEDATAEAALYVRLRPCDPMPSPDDAERDDVGHAVQVLVVEHVGRVRRVLELEGAKGRAVAALAPRAPARTPN